MVMVSSIDSVAALFGKCGNCTQWGAATLGPESIEAESIPLEPIAQVQRDSRKWAAVRELSTNGRLGGNDSRAFEDAE